MSNDETSSEVRSPAGTTWVFWSVATPVILMLLFFAVVGLYGVPKAADRVDHAERQRDRAVLEKLAADLPARLLTTARVYAASFQAGSDLREPFREITTLTGESDIPHSVIVSPGAFTPEKLPAPLRSFAQSLQAGNGRDRAGYTVTDDEVFAVASASVPAQEARVLLARPLDATVISTWQAYLYGDTLRVQAATTPGSDVARALELTDPDGTAVATLGWAAGSLPEVVFDDLAMPLSVIFAFTAFAAALILLRALYAQETLRAAYADLRVQRNRLSEEIASRRKTEARRRVQAAAIDTAADGVCIVDDTGRVSWANTAFIQTTGLSAREVVGQSPESFCADRRSGHTWSDIWRTVHGGTVWRGQLRIVTESGEIRVTHSVVTPVPASDADGATSYVIVLDDVTATVEQERRINYLAFHDPLTGLKNRYAFLEACEQRIGEGKFPFGVLLLDLDGFKAVNDTLGHSVGDRFLAALADRLAAVVREDDVVARLGGDEFAVLTAAGIPSEVLASIAERLLSAVGQEVELEGHRLQLDASIGINTCTGPSATTERLVSQADLALYEAKAEGRGRYCFFDPSLEHAVQSRRSLETDLRWALDNRELELMYQPQVRLSDGALVGAEALIRWDDPERGRLTPGDFIPLAEDTGLIVPIGKWVIETACAQLTAWREAGLDLQRIAVNVSPVQFDRCDVAAPLIESTRRHGLAPDDIDIEITESALMGDGGWTRRNVDTLQRHGFAFAVDDFGKEYSSLRYLRSLPLCRLKIDKSFVANISQNLDDQLLAAVIVEMGHKFGLRVIAEGVERTDQQEWLATIDCDEAQGFLLGAPMASEEFWAIARQWLPRVGNGQ